MIRLKTEVGNLAAVWSGEVAAVKRGVTKAVAAGTAQLQQRLRADTAAAGLGVGNANAWRSVRYPKARDSVNAAGLVYSKSPAVIDGFNKGALIRHRGGRYLAIPTGFNRVGGRRRSRAEGRGERNYWAGVRVTPAEMVASRLSFTLPRREGGLVWCLKIVQAQSKTKKRGRITNQLIAGGLVRVGTGRSRAAAAEIAEQGFVPMFILVRSIKLPKKLDLDARAGEAAAAVAAQITRDLG